MVTIAPAIVQLSHQDIWELGYDPERWRMRPDPKTFSTVIRDGNYDFLIDSQKWHNTLVALPCPSRYIQGETVIFW